MDIKDAYISATLKTVAIKSEKAKGTVALVMDTATDTLYIKKEFVSKAGLDVHRMLQGVSHINLPQILHVIENDSGYTVIEEYAHGETLEQMLEKNILPENDVINCMIQVCNALEMLHGHSPPIIHRDIKPGNIIYTTGGVVKLIDFDAAKEYKSWKSEDTVLMGTRSYAAPEQHGYAMTDARTDIYGLGATAFHLLTGRVHSHVTGFAGYHGKMLSVLTKCLQIDPKYRYENVTALKQDAQRLLVFPLHTNLHTKKKRGNVFFPDLEGKPGGVKAGMVLMYVFLTALLVLSTVAIMEWFPRNEDGPAPIAIYLVVIVMPYILICNTFRLRNRIKYFENKSTFFAIAGVVYSVVIIIALLFSM